MEEKINFLPPKRQESSVKEVPLHARAKLRGKKSDSFKLLAVYTCVYDTPYLLRLQTAGSLYLYMVFPCSFKLYLPHWLQLLPATATVFARCLQCSSFKNWFSTALVLIQAHKPQHVARKTQRYFKDVLGRIEKSV
jgi:hypothetical protein